MKYSIFTLAIIASIIVSACASSSENNEVDVQVETTTSLQQESTPTTQTEQETVVSETPEIIAEESAEESTATETQEEKATTAVAKTQTYPIKDNVIVISEPFSDPENLTGAVHAVNIKNKEFSFLSAYIIQPNVETEIFYRVGNDTAWEDWNPLPHDHEVNNKDRTVFKGPYIFADIQKIQFKAAEVLEKEITFRLYIAE